MPPSIDGEPCLQGLYWWCCAWPLTAPARAAATNQSNWPSAGCARLPSPLKFYAWEGSAMLGRTRAGSPPPLLSGAVCGAQGHHHSTQLDRGHSLDRSLTRSIGVTRSIIHSQSNPGRWHGQGTGEDDPPRPHTDGLPPVVGGGCGWTLGTAKAQVGMSALSHRDRERERDRRGPAFSWEKAHDVRACLKSSVV